VAFSNDGALLAAREFKGVLTIFDGQRPGKPIRSAQVSGEGDVAFHPTAKKKSKDPMGRLAYSPDGKLLVTATLSTGVVGLWDMEKGEMLGEAFELKAPMARVEFDATGELLLLSSYEGAEIHSIAK
jgi:WD40 repeat protein